MRYAQSRLQKNLLMLLAFVFLSAIVWLDNKFHSPATQTPAAAASDVNDWQKYHEKTFLVVKSIDGDTIDINIPDGKFEYTRIRLLGVDTPETKNPYTPVMYFGHEASEYTSKVATGKEVLIVMDRLSKPRDKYKRLLCHIKLPNGKILNEELISEGFAYADPRFPHSFLEEYIQLEKEAKELKKGLWEKVKTEQMPKWRQN